MAQQQSKEEILNQIEKAGHDYEKEFHGCSRCAFRALQDFMDIGDDAVLKASTPFAGGVAMRGETCGALLAGLLAIGIITAKEEFEDTEALTNSLGAGFKLAKKVEKEFGSTRCADIQKSKLGKSYNMADPEEYEQFIKAGGYVECPKVVGKIARMTGDFIFENLMDQQ